MAQGTAQAPIIFTSYADDSAGGDTNNDGAATGPGPQQWNGLVFRPSASGNLLDRVLVRYAGRDVVNTNNDYYGIWIQTSGLTLQNSVVSDSWIGVHIESASPSLANNTIERNSSVGIWVRGVSPNTPITPSLSNNIVRENGNGVILSYASPLMTSNAFQNNTGYAISVGTASAPTMTGNTFAGNGTNGVSWASTLEANTTWAASAGPYVLNGQIPVQPGVTLTIEPGTVVKGLNSTSLLEVSGTLVAQGTAQAPIIFTSYADDSAGGDTNNDGAATGPGPQQIGERAGVQAERQRKSAGPGTGAVRGKGRCKHQQ